ncbi:hypothetical protein LCM20_06575 [Halobacillus litoralis]|uniref:hypothetical protein n=1 Tax=Halobacillus litoralis TaxID=45668 RepID=UPI001CD4F40E|nr:hypothetical protein [Halobacillus litoralis]MCA0970246.1 hypothetical protein [Halobacillus litoralis]
MAWLTLLLFLVGFGAMYMITKKFTVDRSLTKQGFIWLIVTSGILFFVTFLSVRMFS